MRNSLINHPQPKGLRKPPLVGLSASTTVLSLSPKLFVPLPVLFTGNLSVLRRGIEAGVPQVLLEEPLLAPNSSP